MKHKAVIFDLDGTLLDTLEDIADAVNQVLAEQGFAPHPVDQYRLFIGEGSKTLVTRALPPEHRDEKTVLDSLEAFFRTYDILFDQKTVIYDGACELLDELAKLNIKTAVLSNKRHDLTVKCVKHFLGKWRFDAVFGLRKDIPKKPHPAGALEIAAVLALNPNKFLYLGDSGTDMKTALGAGMFPVGALWGLRSREELMANGAQAVIDHPLEILALL